VEAAIKSLHRFVVAGGAIDIFEFVFVRQVVDIDVFVTGYTSFLTVSGSNETPVIHENRNLAPVSFHGECPIVVTVQTLFVFILGEGK